ncbi:hypothetical protein SAMN06269185_2640 [Natronoarchaeum philippinense]|uniref:DUF7511 domain-containing protein n=1 Tax=Natronoarchaeum philippinense TaxID=558529 RepID=A0A285P2F2_NATPI|nr:hypothetical protein [Natronoarchaeum philippinense]SNZ15912.1 hypothetical protein SAMN06269185_2640 [Natronoarchaeum philippinense]
MSNAQSGPTDPVQFGELEHVTVANDGEPTTCTIFPRECSEEKLVTHWITADQSAFVPLDKHQ